MKHTYFIQSFFIFLVLSLSSISCLNAMSNNTTQLPTVTEQSFSNPQEIQAAVEQMSPEEINEALRAIVSICQELLSPILGMLGDLHQVVTQLTHEVGANTIQATDKKRMTHTLVLLSKNIDDLRNNAYTNIDPLQLLLLLKFTQGVTDHILQALKSGFKDIPPFDFEKCIMNNPMPALTDNPFVIIQQEMEKTKQQLTLLAKKAETAGLSWSNTLFRNIDNYIIEPALQKQIITRAGKVIATSAIFLFNLWLFLDTADQIKESGSESSWVLRQLERVNVLKNNIGWCVPRYHQMNPIEPISGILPYLYHYHVRSLQHYLWVPEVLSTAALVWLWKDEAIKIKDTIVKKVATWRNRLKGGEYNKQADRINNIMPEITFDDIVGHDHVKAKMNEVIDYMLHPERFDRTQALPERGYLFIGEPGTGKTEFAKALYGEIKKRLRELGRNEDEIQFLSPPISIIMESKGGVKDLWGTALAIKPCIVFVDEIDFLKLQRWSGDNKNLSDFLQLMNGVIDLGPKQQIVFIGATNKAQFLDFALKRPGRFGVQLSFNLPSLQHRHEFITKLIGKLGIELDSTEIDLFAQKTAGCTYEDIRNIIKGVIRKSQTSGVTLNMQELELSHDENVRNIVMLDDKVPSQQDLKIISTHLAGHAMAHVLLETNHQIAKVTTRPIQQKMRDEGRWQVYDKKPEHEKQRPLVYGNVFTFCPHDTLNLMSEVELHNQGKILMAGYAAERVLLGTAHNYHIGCDGDIDDKKEAYQLALDIVLRGFDIRELSKNKQQEVRDQAYELVKQWEQDMVALFEQNKQLVNSVAIALESKRSLSGEEVDTLIEQHKNIAS